ncbi:MAG: hypothetical protein K9M44_01635, partial [Candidatus Pacebacteria bacterium]|nr:hypothetical protein [Candidatus Paceibacterota bacterium]
PFSLYFWQKNTLKTKNIFPLMALLILPISVFTITTPQNLSYSLLLVSIFLNLSQSKRGLALASLLSVATFFIHPLAGIPALIFSFLNISYFYRQSLGKTKEKILSWIITILTALALPASFLIINNFKFNLSSPFKLGLFQYLSWPGQENLVFNSVYLYIFNLPILILILIISGIVLWFKQYKQQTPALAVSLKLSLAMFIAYILSQYISFEFLIEYEREYYRQRLLVLTLFFALPFIVFTLKNLFSQLKTQNKTLKIFILIILSLTITASVYYSYPRKDKYFNSHSISVSTADIETVSFIENQAGGDDYIVLANQQVSVAALKTFGFNRYLQDNLYFYPIPTSGPLYPFYLQMVYDYPSFQNMEKALKMSGASKGFLVINKYWWGFKKLVEEAKNEADNFYQLQNGDVYIFEYNL